MNLRPSVSVCIPCYNGAEFLGRTLESVLAQTYSDFEIVIADNRSTDQTVAIIQSFADPRIRLILNEQNLGMAQNWNKVLSQSKGKYVKLLCADDLLHPGCLARQVSIMEDPANSNVVLTVCKRRVIDSNDAVVLSRRLPLRSGRVEGSRLMRKSVRWGTNVIGEPVVGLFRKDALVRTTTWDPSNDYLSDMALWAELLKHGDAFVDESCLASFRISSSAASAKIGRAHAVMFRSFVRSLRRERHHSVTAFDMAAGYVMSFNWCILRNLFINLHCKAVRRSPRPMSLAAHVQVAVPEVQPVSASSWPQSLASNNSENPFVRS